MSDWIEIKDETTWPTNVVGEQKDVEFFGKGWSWAIVGLVTRLDDDLEWMEYDQQNDKYLIWQPAPDFYRFRTTPE